MKTLVKKQQEDAQGASTWLISFTDVVALMLTFFVLIFSMSEPIQNTVSEDISVMQENANTQDGAPDFAGSANHIEMTRDSRASGLDLTYLQTLLTDMLAQLVKDEPKLSGIKLQRADNMLFIRIPNRVIRRDDAMIPLAAMLGRLRNDIAIWTPVNESGQTYAKALRGALDLQTKLTDGGYPRSILLKTFAPFYSKGLSAQLHIAIMETKAVSP